MFILIYHAIANQMPVFTGVYGDFDEAKAEARSIAREKLKWSELPQGSAFFSLARGKRPARIHHASYGADWFMILDYSAEALRQ